MAQCYNKSEQNKKDKYKQRRTWEKTKQYCSVGENHSLGLIPYQMLGEYLPIISKSKQGKWTHQKHKPLSITEFLSTFYCSEHLWQQSATSHLIALCEYCSHTEGEKEIIELFMAAFSWVYFIEHELKSFWIIRKVYTKQREYCGQMSLGNVGLNKAV